ISDNDPQTKNKAGVLQFHPDGRPKQTGQDHADQVCAELSTVAKRVCHLNLGKAWSECPSKGDITDWIAAGGTPEALYGIVEELPAWTPPKPDDAPPVVLSLDDWLARELPAPDFIMGNWLTTTSRILLTAPTGLGKTMFGIALSFAVA